MISAMISYTTSYPIYCISLTKLWLCSSGGMFHYKKNMDAYSIDHPNQFLFRKSSQNVLVNNFGIYILSELHKFQNMKSYAVHQDTDIDEYVKHSKTLHDGTVVHRFSKELLSFLETLVAFSPYYRANDARCAGAMDTFYYDALKSYNTLSYDELHKFLAKRLHVWYAKFRPAGAREEDKDPSDGEVGSVVNTGIIPPAAAAGPAFSIADDDEAAPRPAAAAAAPAAPAPDPDADAATPPPGGG